MAERRPFPADLPVAELELALVDLGRRIAWPAAPAGPGDLAARTRALLAARGPVVPRPGGLAGLLPRRPLRRAIVLALVAVLAIAVVAGAIGIGLPGLRIILGGPMPSTPVATLRPSAGLGSSLGLGSAVTLDEARTAVGFELRLPSDPAIGPPDAVYLAGDDRVALVWRPSAALPDAEGDGIGLLVTAIDGRVSEGYIEKILQEGTVVERISVGGARGLWIEGPPHFFQYVDPSGQDVEDTHRPAGDTLAWTIEGVTYRMEGSVGRDAAIALAETFG
jgi:hypothetical protein